MDGNHAGGCSLIGLALTALLMRLFWMTSPPFSTMEAGKLAKVKLALAVFTAVGLAVGGYYISQPNVQSVAQQTGEEGFHFH
jgi:hypothetical protein